MTGVKSNSSNFDDIYILYIIEKILKNYININVMTHVNLKNMNTTCKQIRIE